MSCFLVLGDIPRWVSSRRPLLMTVDAMRGRAASQARSSGHSSIPNPISQSGPGQSLSLARLPIDTSRPWCAFSSRIPYPPRLVQRGQSQTLLPPESSFFAAETGLSRPGQSAP